MHMVILRKKVIVGLVKDLTGQTFGLLTVLCRAKNNSENKARWYCECECGNYCERSSANLKDGHKSSCGCHRRVEMRKTMSEKWVRFKRLEREAERFACPACGLQINHHEHCPMAPDGSGARIKIPGPQGP